MRETYPGPGERHQISVRGGTQPAWARNGRALFHTVADADRPNAAHMMAVDIATTPTFTAGVPRALKSVVSINSARGYDVSRDGRRFVTVRENNKSPEPPPTQMILVQNWFEELKRRVPTK
jgi:hypothetical protein